MKAFLDDSKLRALFMTFDTDNSGTITRENIVSAMQKVGHEINQDELDQIMHQHDIEKNNVITYIEFKALLLDIDDLKQAEDF